MPKLQQLLLGVAGTLLAGAIGWLVITLVSHESALAVQSERNNSVHEKLNNLEQGQKALTEGQNKILIKLGIPE